jgi:hypothetical protein
MYAAKRVKLKPVAVKFTGYGINPTTPVSNDEAGV